MSSQLDEQYQELGDEKPKRGPGRPKGSTSAKKKTPPKKKPAPGRPSLWLEKKEAEIISKAIQFGMLTRYGAEPELPDKKAQEHLAHVIKKYSDVFPLSWIQGFIRRLMPLHDPNSKPGGSTLGDLAQYLGGWHRENPDLYQEVLGAEGIFIPFVMEPPAEMFAQAEAQPAAFRIPRKDEVEKAWGRRMSGDEYNQYLQEMGVTMHPEVNNAG